MLAPLLLATLSSLVATLSPAHALSLTLSSEDVVAPGITVRQYRTRSPTTNTWVASIDLCANGVYLDATRAPDATQSTGSWGADADVTLATNGDFYKTGPVRVYGDAVGGGVAWPTVQTGRDTAYASEWYYQDYGWVAVGHDWVDYTHTKWVKSNASLFGTLGGWEPSTRAPAPPVGTLALVSGFPELVVEGTAMTCADPEASTCFPDRSDMRDRNPRTAIGLTEDRETLLLVVVDGRTSSSSGMYGSELADLMSQLGAWVAFNHDGGGSSQMWVDGDGYLNDISGNNNGSGTRAVANHWGVFAGGRSYLADRPGHCASAPSCGELPASGGTIDNRDACFRGFGDQAYWRSAAGGVGGRLQWTNAFRSSTPDNWAWWRLDLAEAGTYRVEVSVDATYSVHRAVRYEVRHGGAVDTVTIDPTTATSWATVGTFDFAEGGEQWVKVTDHVSSGSVASDQHIVADAVRLVRVDPYCGDGACSEGETCGSCPGDCPPVDEVRGNGVDDDCDGSVDEGGADTGGGNVDSGGSVDSGAVDTSAEDVPEPDTATGDALDTAGVALPGTSARLDGAGGCGCASGGSGGGAVTALGLAAAFAARARRRPSA